VKHIPIFQYIPTTLLLIPRVAFFLREGGHTRSPACGCVRPCHKTSKTGLQMRGDLIADSDRVHYNWSRPKVSMLQPAKRRHSAPRGSCSASRTETSAARL
jgi:hypothetical protein